MENSTIEVSASEIVELLKDPESKLIVRRILNLLQSKETIVVLLNDLNTAMAKNIQEIEKHALLRVLFNLASIAKSNLKKDKKNASIY